MKPSAPVCPVPNEQQPINEFKDLSESWFFRWATLDLVSYVKPIVILWCVSWLMAWPVASVSFPVSKYPAQFILSGAAGACLVPLLALVRLGLGWKYVCDRLSSDTIFYEESGWYDGQTWKKPDAILQRDRLIVTYQIQPILRRLMWTFGSFGLLFSGGLIIWVILASQTLSP